MPAYKYCATDINGKMLKGEMEAADEKQLKDNLTLRKQYLISCETYNRRLIAKPLSQLDIADMCRQMGSMLQSGITVVKSISILLSRDMNPNMKIVLEYMYRQIKLGNAFSEAMKQTDAFPQLLVSMIEAGEASGNTEKILLRMAEYYENEYKTAKNVKSALSYPAFLAVLLVAAIIGIFTFIIPKFVSVFDGVELPALTQIVLNISNFLISSWYILAAIAVGLVFITRLLFSFTWVKVHATKLLLHMGKFGRLFGIIYTARFCRTFSELYASGLPIISDFQISKSTVGCPYIESQFDDVIKEIRQGVSIADAVSKVDGFDTKLKSAVLIGEESGRLEFMLTTMAESFEFESEQAIKKITGLIEPIMIVTMGLLVALVFVSVMLPVFTLYDAVSG